MIEKQMYNKLWDWVYAQPVGEYELVKLVSPQKKVMFTEIIKGWIRHDEFRVFNFYLEYNNNYTRIIKKEYPYNQMEYLEKLEKEKT